MAQSSQIQPTASLPALQELNRIIREELEIAKLNTGSEGLAMTKIGDWTWIHVPSTNGDILIAILRSIQRTYPEFWPLEQSAEDLFLKSFQKSSRRPKDPLLIYREPSCESIECDNPNKTVTREYTSIVFPCLALQDMQSQKDRKTQYQELTTHTGRNSSLCNIHLERTLDEAYYPGLPTSVLETRNQDQVVSREYSKMDPISKNQGLPILMVPQLWLWRMGSYILSAYSMTEQSVMFQKKKSSDENNSNEDWDLHWGSHPLAVPIIAIIADHIEKFGQPQKDTKFPPPLDIFESGVVRILSDVDEYMDSATPATLNIKKEREFLHDIADIRAELAMIQDVFDQQDEVLDILLDLLLEEHKKRDPKQPWGVKYDGEPFAGKQEVEASIKRIAKYRQRAQKIDKDAERIEKMIQDQLNLKRTYASIRDTRTSVVLGTAVIGFTVITIIFAPLAFLASLFALPLDKFLQNQITIGDKDAYSTGYIGKWLAVAEVVSLVVTGVVVWASLWLIDVGAGTLRGKAETEKNANVTLNAKPKIKSEKDARFSRLWHRERADVLHRAKGKSRNVLDPEKGPSVSTQNRSNFVD